MSVASSIHNTCQKLALSSKTIYSSVIGSYERIRFITENNPMKRTRATAVIEQNAIENNEETANEPQTTSKVVSDETQSVPRPRLNLRSLRRLKSETVHNKTDVHTDASFKRSKNTQKQLEVETLVKKDEEELKPNTSPSKGKLRAVVDLRMMKEELSQLEDPPMTPWEKKLSSGRLQYEFFNIPCEELAQRLLGKVLVRYLENGTILKGRIVETEGYLGTVDKASHSYQNKVTPRNLPMYMPPGTIYVYMTYGMYYCFNISSQEPNAYVLIRAVEPLLGLEYMELLRNMRRKDNGKQKRIAECVTRLKQYELCNDPFKTCDAFAIDEEAFDRKPAYACSNLWFESDGCAVLVRAIDPLEGIEHMADQRNISKSRKTSLKSHELCNGPSKLCMAYRLHKKHSRYSICSWKGLWIEDDDVLHEFKIVKTSRIGIDSCGPEWANKPLRYYIYGNKSVSKRDKKAEIDVS